LDKGADVKAKLSDYSGRTALQAALENCHEKIAKLLLEKGTDVNARPSGHEGMTALHAAVEHGQLDLIKPMFKKGLNVANEDGTNALRAADAKIYSEIRDLLLERGAYYYLIR
jgi:ankyrin repeat protein